MCPKCRATHPEETDLCPDCAQPLCEAEDLNRVGLKLGSYQITEIIGVGGMGVVYRAIHNTLLKPVAIKILNDRYLRRRDAAREMLREAQAASRIRHPHIVNVTDFGTAPDGAPYFVMEYLEGESLNELLGRVGRLPLGRAARIMQQVAGALGAAHRLGIIHRDLKPENIFLLDLTAADATQPGDFIKLLDFGLAKVMDMGPSSRTRAGMLAGTPFYMSPEQAQNRAVDPRSDIYSLGIVFYQIVTGTVPFTGDSPVDILMGHISVPVIQPCKYCRSIDEETNAVIMRCLEKDPDKRFQSVEELCIALERCGTQLQLESGDILPDVVARLRGGPAAVALGAPTVTSELMGQVLSQPASLTVESGLFQKVLAPASAAMADPSTLVDDEVPPPRRPHLVYALAAVSVLAIVAAAVTVAVTGREATSAMVDVHKVPRARDVQIRLRGLPDGARVLLDGRPTTQRPIQVARADRSHTVRVEAPGHLPSEVSFRASRDQELVFQLEPEPRVALADGPAPKPAPKIRPRRSAVARGKHPAKHPPRKRPGKPGNKLASAKPKLDPKAPKPGQNDQVDKPAKPEPKVPRPKASPKKYRDWVVDPEI